MSYFTEVQDYQSYAKDKADFHFSYNANSGGGQSFLGGQFADKEGTLFSPTSIDGYTGIFSLSFLGENGQETIILLNDEKGRYEIKPRGEGSSSMKLGIGSKMVSPSRLISSFFMLPPTCTVKSPNNLDNSILTSNNYWLQSMWLKCSTSSTNGKEAYLIPIDYIFSGGSNKNNEGTNQFFQLDAQKRITDIIRLSEESECLPENIRQYITVFSNIYLQITPFEYDICSNAINKVMALLAKLYPTQYSGIEDPLPFLMSIIELHRRKKKNQDISISYQSNSSYITALRAKPFLLLAGISGTGKSQKVQELAFMSCPEELREENITTPGNYCLVEVKPNWHDSTELLGYYSALSGRYELTDFIRFTYKALTNHDTPFFLCLDEMNLAPVEQYFAEYLSVLETRKRIVDEEGVKILTEPLLTKDKFSNCKLNERVPKQTTGYILDGDEYDEKPLYSPDDAEIIAYLKNNGLHLPDNLFVIGTVNMDDTTHQFSRKVIDRAFTIEMNGGKMDEMFSTESRNNLEYRAAPLPLSAFKSEFVRAYEVLEDERFAKYAETITTRIPELLGNSDGTASEDSINGILNGTPFRVSYRVQNELVLYLSVLIENAGFPDDIEPLVGEATLAILMEKVLPRIQGEQKQLETKGGKSNVLKDMKSFVGAHFKPADETVPEIYDKVIKKLDEMDGKLSGYYTNFF